MEPETPPPRGNVPLDGQQLLRIQDSGFKILPFLTGNILLADFLIKLFDCASCNTGRGAPGNSGYMAGHALLAEEVCTESKLCITVPSSANLLKLREP